MALPSVHNVTPLRRDDPPVRRIGARRAATTSGGIASRTTWLRSPGLEALCSELADAVIGHPTAPGSHAIVLARPTDDDGAVSFVNHVFALRSYCSCDGAVHGKDDTGIVACPPNFEFFQDGRSTLQGEWFRRLGPGTLFTAAPTAEGLALIRWACLSSLHR